MNDQSDAPQVLDSKSDLEQFFADQSGPVSRAIYQDVDFETFAVGAPNVVAALLLSYWYGLFARWERDRRGRHVKVRLPAPIGADLLLESRAKAVDDDDLLQSRFVWVASSERRVRKAIAGPLLEALCQIADSCSVVVTDRFLSFGPLPREPEACAGLVVSLIEALPRSTVSDAQELSGPPYRGEAKDPGKMVVIATTANRRQTDLWCGKLEAAKVAYDVYGYDESQPWGAATPMRPIEVSVYEVDRARAIELLESTIQEATFCHHCGESTEANAESCPGCGEALA